MALITKYGSQFGTVPPTTGRVYFVAPSASYTVNGFSYPASDDNDGLSPEKALLTINRFVTLATADVGDTAILLSGTHTVASTVRITKSGLTVLGVHGQHGRRNIWRLKSVISAVAQSVAAISVEANDTEIGYLEFRGDDARSIMIFPNDTTNGVDGLYVHDCKFRLANVTVSTNNQMIDFSSRAPFSRLNADGRGDFQLGSSAQLATAYLENCLFESDGAHGPAINIATAAVHITGCRFHNQQGTWGIAVAVGTSADGCVIEHCSFTTGGTMGVPISGTTADITGAVFVRYTDFGLPMTNNAIPIEDFTIGVNNAGEAMIGGGCYIMTATGACAMYSTATPSYGTTDIT